MFSFSPLLIEIVVFVIIELAVFGGGYYEGYKHEKTKLMQFEVSTMQVQAQQVAQAQQADQQHQQEMKSAKTKFEQDVANIRNYYRNRGVIRLYNNASSTDAVPQTDSNSQGIDDSSSSVHAATDVAEQPVTPDCATEAAKLKELQDLLNQDGVQQE